MFDMFKTLTAMDILYAAVLAFVLMKIILSISSITKKISKIKIDEENMMNFQRSEVIKKCKLLFPLETIDFRGKVFTKGAYVRITTLQKRIFEGEIIGKNEKNMICVIVGEHIIAHDIDKIEDIIEVTTKESINA